MLPQILPLPLTLCLLLYKVGRLSMAGPLNNEVKIIEAESCNWSLNSF